MVKVEPNQQKIVKLLSALIAASAIVVMAVLAVALNEEQTGTVLGPGPWRRRRVVACRLAQQSPPPPRRQHFRYRLPSRP